MAVGEIFLAAFLQVLFDRLASKEVLSFARLERLEKNLDKWRKMLSMIQNVLDDAEEKELHAEPSVKVWLEDLKDLAYDVEDVLDEFATEALRCNLKGTDQASTSKVRNPIPACFCGLTPRAILLRARLESSIKNITAEFKNIVARKGGLNLKEHVDKRSEKIRGAPLALTSVVNEARVYGRDIDKMAILDLLQTRRSSDTSVSVIPIHGMGGIGKTTLAQLIYNDRKVESLFDLKAWACVSEDFDAVRVTQTILRCLNPGTHDENDLNLLQIELKKTVKGKKFLVILDDLWNESYHDWTILFAPFKAGAPGSAVIITTRNRGVSSMTGTTQAYQLDLLSNDACGSLFTQHALGVEDFSSHAHLKDVGWEIIKKCKGLPLAAKTLGGLLRSKQDRDDWEEVLNSEIWDIPEEKSGIAPALMLSYYHLPSHLKRCFAYCSILPKDYEFEEKQVVLLWMAEGLIQQRQNEKELEYLGAEYFRDLLSRSFFQQSGNNKSRFIMHDLINDLAISVAGKTCFGMKDRVLGSKQGSIFKKTRHLSFQGDNFDAIKKFEAFFELTCLRTFLPLWLPSLGWGYLTSNVPLQLLPKLRCLRVLSLKGYHITEISNSIGDLTHLRYLDLSFTCITSLPESTTTLYNLQMMLLEGCEYLEKLPSTFENLVNLRHLNILRATSLKAMPLHIDKLTCLRTLSNFIVGKDCCSGLKELGALPHLQGTICISGLENVIEPGDARVINLSEKPKLVGLSLGWSEEIGDSKDRTREKEFLDMLQPHNSLKDLTIRCYGGTEFPTWLKHHLLSNLVLLTIENCKKCTSLPPLGKLPSLKVLSIEGIDSMKSIGLELCGDGSSRPFRSLETLNFKNMVEWENWRSPCEAFSNLRELSIKNCPKLLGNLPDHFPLLEKVEIDRCWNLVYRTTPVSSFPDRCKINIGGSEGVVCGREVEFSSLKFEVLSTISELESRIKMFSTMGGLVNVQNLNVYRCEELTHLWSNLVGSFPLLPHLLHLQVSECPKLVSLVAKGQLPPTLKELRISNCENMQILVEEDDTNSSGSSGENSTSLLQHLSISQCPSLKYLISNGELPAAVQTISIRSCPELELIAKEFNNNSFLESIYIYECGNLKSLPTGAHILSHLDRIHIEGCPSLDILPDGELFAANLTDLALPNCKKMQAVLNRIHTCTSLQSLRMENFPGVPPVSFPEEGFPTNLTHLSILDSRVAQGLFEWGLHRITSLKYLRICGESSHPVSFPGMKLPTSLTQLCIDNFPNLKYLNCEGFQNLTSLKVLSISDCKKLKSFKKKKGLPPTIRTLSIVNCKKFASLSTNCLPPSLQLLEIYGCPLLEERYKKDRGREWLKIAHIPRVSFSIAFILTSSN